VDAPAALADPARRYVLACHRLPAVAEPLLAAGCCLTVTRAGVLASSSYVPHALGTDDGSATVLLSDVAALAEGLLDIAAAGKRRASGTETDAGVLRQRALSLLLDIAKVFPQLYLYLNLGPCLISI